MKTLSRYSLFATLAFLAACTGSDMPAEEGMPEAAVEATAEATPFAVAITGPADGAEVDGPDVVVTMEASGVTIVPAGELVDGTGHHHIYLDADLGVPGTPVPTVPNQIIHLGDGSATYTFTDVAPGEHRLIAVVADGLHIPLQPWVVDTVTFTVR
jgi:hypothetical protein